MIIMNTTRDVGDAALIMRHQMNEKRQHVKTEDVTVYYCRTDITAGAIL